MSGFGFLTLIGFLLFVALILYILYVGSQRSQGKPIKYSLAIITGLLVSGVVFSTLGRGLVFIQPQERGVVLNLFSRSGVRDAALDPGVHFITPFVESVRTYSIGQRAYTMSGTSNEGQVAGNDSVTARTADGQEVFIDATVQYQVNSDRLVELYIRWTSPDGEELFEDKLVRPQARSVVYNAVAQYKVEEVYSTKRDEMQKKIDEQLRAAFEANGLRLTSFLLRNITFNKEYSDSVEQKQVAQQQAERAKFLVESERQEAERVRVKAQGEADATVTHAKADAESRIIAAKAEAEALRQVSDALKQNPDLLTYRYIEKIAPSIQTILIPSGQNFLLDPRSLISGSQTGPQRPSTSTSPSIAPSTTITP